MGLIERARPRVTTAHAPARLGLDDQDTRVLDRLLDAAETAAGEAAT